VVVYRLLLECKSKKINNGDTTCIRARIWTHESSTETLAQQVKRSSSHLRVVEVYDAADGSVPSPLQDHDIAFAQHVLVQGCGNQDRANKQGRDEARKRGLIRRDSVESHPAIAHYDFKIDVRCRTHHKYIMDSKLNVSV